MPHEAVKRRAGESEAQNSPPVRSAVGIALVGAAVLASTSAADAAGQTPVRDNPSRW
jgi:hypothetical protein